MLLCILMLRYPLKKKKKVEFILLDLALSNLCENCVWGVGKQNSQVLLSCFLHRGRLIPCWFSTHKVPECPELPQSEQFPSCLSPTIILFDQSSVSSPWGNWSYKHWQPSGRRYDGPHSDSVQDLFLCKKKWKSPGQEMVTPAWWCMARWRWRLLKKEFGNWDFCFLNTPAAGHDCSTAEKGAVPQRRACSCLESCHLAGASLPGRL